MTDKTQQGIYRKFEVRRTDGTDAPGQKHDGCRYFVLDVTHDPYAIPALKAYAKACEPFYPALAADLRGLLSGDVDIPPADRERGTPEDDPQSPADEAEPPTERW